MQKIASVTFKRGQQPTPAKAQNNHSAKPQGPSGNPPNMGGSGKK